MSSLHFSYLFPILLVIVSNVAYHTLSKQTPAQVNPFLSCGITYAIAFCMCALLFGVTKKDTVTNELRHLNYISYLLGFIIVGLEGGFLLAYRAGWPVNRASLISNLCVAVILLLIGLVFFREGLSPKQCAGIALCIIGVLLINQ